MKKTFLLLAGVLASPVIWPSIGRVALAQQNAPVAPGPLIANSVLVSMKRVADWHLAHPNPRQAKTGWEQGVGDAGIMALYEVSKDQKYLDAMFAMGQGNGWKPGTRPYHADDHMVVQTYVDVYRAEKNAAMIAPARARFDAILQNPKTRPLSKTERNPQDRWVWCDALFMAPPAWARMAAATGATSILWIRSGGLRRNFCTMRRNTFTTATIGSRLSPRRAGKRCSGRGVMAGCMRGWCAC